MASKIYDRDQPIDGSESKPDKLNRDSFAKHLAEIIHIKPNEDCFTVSVEGEWGGGKSSVLAMVKRHLRALDNPPIIVEFNPWLIGDVDSLVQKFLVQFAAQLDIPDRPKETLKAAKELLAYSKLFDVAKLIPGAEPWATTIQSVVSGVGFAADKIGKLKELDIESRKNRVKAAVESLRRSIVVFIDDIDRLTPEEAFQVIRLSKAIADFKGCTFVLAFDHEYLADVLRLRGIHNSDQYIEKVVQLRVPLPLITSEEMHGLIDESIDSLSERSLTDKFKDDKERLSSVYFGAARHLMKTPRDVKRIVNHLRFVLLQTEGEVCFTDLFLLSVLAISAPEVYKSIKVKPNAYIGTYFDDKYQFEKQKDVVKEHSKFRDSILDAVRDDKRDYLARILKELFPLVAERDFVVYGENYDSTGRVASASRLSIAMHYQVPTGQVSDNAVDAFILGKTDRADYAISVCDSGSVSRFFDILSHKIALLCDKHLDVFPELYDAVLGSKQISELERSGGSGFFSLGPYLQLVWLTRDVLDKLVDRVPLLNALFSVSSYLPITTHLLRMLQTQHGEIEKDSQSVSDVQWVSKSDFDDLKARWVETALAAFKDSDFFDLPNIAGPFYRLLSLAPNDLRGIVGVWLDECDGIKKIASLVGYGGRDSVKGAFCHAKEDDLRDILDLDRLRSMVAPLLESGRAVEPYYLAIYRSILTGKKHYLVDGSEARSDW